MTNATRFSVRFVNLGYSHDETFATVEAAVSAGKAAHFSFAVDGPQGCVCGWDAIGGLVWYDEAARDAHYNAVRS